MREIMKVLRCDIYRLFNSNRLILAFIIYILVVHFCNYSDIFQSKEFMSVDYLIDCITESGWFRELLYVISAFPFVLSHCEDVKNHYILNIVTRTSITAYALSKTIVTIFSTFFISITGFIISIVLFSFLYPTYDPYAHSQLNLSGAYGVLTIGQFPFTFFVVRVLLFASGSSLWAIISLLVSSYKPDFFLTTAMPFISSYIIFRFAMNFSDFLNIDYCISGYRVIKNTSILYNFIFAMSYIWLLILIISIAFIKQLERNKQ